MPTLKELVKHDPAIRNVLIGGAAFLFLPPVVFYFQDPFRWSGKGDDLPFYILGLGGPYVVMAVVLFRRWRKLTKLAKAGVRIPGVIEKTRTTREGDRAIVRFTFEGTERRVDLEIPARQLGAGEGAEAILLVDPDNPKNVSIVDVRSALLDVRSKLRP